MVLLIYFNTRDSSERATSVVGKWYFERKKKAQEGQADPLHVTLYD